MMHYPLKPAEIADFHPKTHPSLRS